MTSAWRQRVAILAMVLPAGLLMSCVPTDSDSDSGTGPTESTDEATGSTDEPTAALPPLEPYFEALPVGETPQNPTCSVDAVQDDPDSYRISDPEQVDEGAFEARVENGDQAFIVTFRGPVDADILERMTATRVCLEAYEFSSPESPDVFETSTVSVQDVIVEIVSEMSEKSPEEIGTDRDNHMSPGPQEVTLAELIGEYGNLDLGEVASAAKAELSGRFSASADDIADAVEELLDAPGAPFLPSPGEVISAQLPAEDWAREEGNLLIEVELIEAPGLDAPNLAVGFAFDPEVHLNFYPQRIYYRAKCQSSVKVALHRKEGSMRVKLYREDPLSFIGERTGNLLTPDPPPLSRTYESSHIFDITVHGLRDKSWYSLDGSWTVGVDTC